MAPRRLALLGKVLLLDGVKRNPGTKTASLVAFLYSS